MNRLINIDSIKNYSVLTLSNPPANVLNIQLLKELHEKLCSIDPSKPIIIKNNGNIFSAGIDLFESSFMNKNKLIDFINLFEKVLLKIKFHPSLTITILNGHAIAGGFIIACSTDYIFSNKENYWVGLNEKKLGFSLPTVPYAIINNKFKRYSNKILNSKNFYTISNLMNIPNFITIVDQPNNYINNLILNHKDVSKMKMINKEIMTRFINKNKIKLNKKFYDGWFSEKSIKARQNQLEKIKKN